MPASGDTVLVSKTAHDAQGQAFRQTDAQGAVTLLRFDQTGRPVGLTRHGAGDPDPGQSQEADCTSTADGKVATLTVRNSLTGDQTTRFVYGTTLADSDVASSALLSQQIYPLGQISYTYNRLGERK